MQTSTELTITDAKQKMRALLREAIDHHERSVAARRKVADRQDEALFEAWQSGIRLNQIKRIIGHGNWLPWLELNFCKPGDITPRMAQIYMKIDADNPNAKRV